MVVGANAQLASLDGLDGLQSVGGAFLVGANANLLSMQALAGLRSFSMAHMMLTKATTAALPGTFDKLEKGLAARKARLLIDDR